MPAAAQRVGVNSAVNPEAHGTPPGGATRQLVIGQEVVRNERIVTGPTGQTQLLLLDESAITVGPNSVLTLDEFVYDPNSGTGHLDMSASGGTVRFVGGKVSKGENQVTLRTPTAILGVRGGVFVMSLVQGKLEVVFLYGSALTVTGNNVTQTITRPGFAVTVNGPGAAPSTPGPASNATLANLLGQLSGSGASSGSGTPVVDPNAGSGVGGTGSTGGTGGTGQNQQFSFSSIQSLPVSTGNLQTANAVELNIINATIAANNNAANNNNAPGNTPNPPPPPPVVVRFSGTIKDTVGPAGPGGFVDQSARGRIPYSGTVTFPAGTQDGLLATTANGLTFAMGPLTPGQTTNVVSLRSDGQSASGTATVTADGTFFYADLVGSGGNRQFFYGGIPVAQSFFTRTSPNNQFLAFGVQADAALSGAGGQAQTIPFLPADFGGTFANATVSSLRVVVPANTPFAAAGGNRPSWLQASLAVNGQGVDQTSALVVSLGNFLTAANGSVVGAGHIRGTINTEDLAFPVTIAAATHTVPDANGNALFGGATPTGFVLDQNGFNPALASATPTGDPAIGYAFNQPVLASADPQALAGVGVNRAALNEPGFFGGIGVSTRGGQLAPSTLSGTVALQTDPAGNHVAAQFTGSDLLDQTPPKTTVLNFGSLTEGSGRSVYIDNNLFAAVESSDQPSSFDGTPAPRSGTALALVSSGAVPNTSWMPPGVTPCDCQFVRWGYWAGQIPTPSDGSPDAIHSYPIGTWVSGVPTVTMPIAGIATHNGAAVGTVFNGATNATYLAAGQYSQTYNFAARSGSSTISNFDGAVPYNFFLLGVPGKPAAFSGTIAEVPNTTGFINGSFFGPGAIEVGGAFGISKTAGGQNYIASGVFTGR